MIKKFVTSKMSILILSIFFLLTLWWVKIYVSGVRESDENNYYGLAYAVIALIGGINGLIIGRKWGGFGSLVGRSISFLSLGLLSICFGQVVWSYYSIVLKVEVPYPSLADLGYFTLIPMYGLGMYSFAKSAGASISLKHIRGKLAVFVIPTVLLLVTYAVYLQSFTPDLSMPVKSFLDFFTPLGDSIVFSLGILAYLLTKKTLGGTMRPKILLINFALLFEFIIQFSFLYKVSVGTYYNGGPLDYLWTMSFTLMALCLNAFNSYKA